MLCKLLDIKPTPRFREGQLRVINLHTHARTHTHTHTHTHSHQRSFRSFAVGVEFLFGVIQYAVTRVV